MKRILVTGSRAWTDFQTIHDALRDAFGHPFPQDVPTLVHGACRSGADKIADSIWTLKGYPVERHPADWDRYGPMAGPLRNRLMVNAGADICLAFIQGESRGTRMTADYAESVGIPVRRFIR